MYISNCDLVDRNGRATIWDIESNSLSILRRTDATPENLKIGDTVKMAGWRSRRSSERLFVLNVLTKNGQELVLDRRAKPRWSTAVAGLKTTWFEGGTVPNANTGIF